MRKNNILNWIKLSSFIFALSSLFASCSNELDEALQPASNGTLQFVVSDFPMFGEGIQTRVIGTQDEGKTAWEKDDQIIVTLTSQKYGEQAAALTYNGSSWSTEASLSYLENETPTVSAVYAPGCKISENNIVLDDNQVYGMSEYIHAFTKIEGKTLRISFEGVERNYSRLRIAAMPKATLTVTTTGFTPAGPEGATAPESYTLTTDDKSNAFLYGIFAESATVSVKLGDITLKDYTFTAEKNPNGTEQGKSYALDVTTKLAFSVASDRQVLFSQGNLQYHPKNDKWRFATKQTESIGADNANISSTYNGWIDLFGWSASTANDKFGVSTSIFVTDYTGDFVDWGKNQIGDYAPDTWRTMSDDEWEYLISKRKQASSLQGVAQVDGVNGLILLPDNWSCPSGVTFKSGYHSESTAAVFAQYQTFTAAQWAKLETNGAIFLPTTGYRDGSMVSYTASIGFYWSSEGYSSNGAYELIIRADKGFIADEYRYYGQAVRLVKDL